MGTETNVAGLVECERRDMSDAFKRISDRAELPGIGGRAVRSDANTGGAGPGADIEATDVVPNHRPARRSYRANPVEKLAASIDSAHSTGEANDATGGHVDFVSELTQQETDHPAVGDDQMSSGRKFVEEFQDAISEVVYVLPSRRSESGASKKASLQTAKNSPGPVNA